MAQRVALLIDGTNVRLSAKRRGMDLDYKALIQYVAEGKRGRDRPGLGRDLVVAQVYVGPTANPNPGRGNFLDIVARLGYQVRVCQEDGNGLKSAVDQEMLHDLLVLTLTGRVDAVVLVTGDGGFMRGIRTAQSHGVQVEVLGFADHTAEAIRQGTHFVDLGDTYLLRAAAGGAG